MDITEIPPFDRIYNCCYFNCNRTESHSNQYIYNMTHNYNGKHNPLVANNEENNVSGPQTSDLIINLEKKIVSCFNGLDKDLFVLKDVVIKDSQIENQRSRMKVNNLENKNVSFEMIGNHLEQYGRRNNLEITGIPDDVSEKYLEEKVIQVLSEIQVNVSSSDIEACNRIGKSKNSSKKTIVRFVNRKYAKKALINRKGLMNICKFSLSMSSSDNIYINENLTPMNNKIAFHCGKLKHNGQIDKTYSKDWVIHIASSNITYGTANKILHMSILLDIFPDFNFGPDAREEEHND